MNDKKRRLDIRTLIFSVLGFILFFLFTTSAMAGSAVYESNQPVRRECQISISYRDLFSGSVIELVDLPTRIYWSVGQFFTLDHTFFYRCSDTEQFNEALQIFASIAEPKLELVIHNGLRYDFAPKKTRVDWTFTIWNQKGLDDLFKKNEEIAKIFERKYGSTIPAPRIDVYIGGGSIIWKEVKIPVNPNLSVTDKRLNLGEKEISRVSQQISEEPVLPEEISEFYEKWNFISVLSTPEERSVLLNYIEKQENLPEQMMQDERLKKTHGFIMELDKYELPGIDPDFVHPKKSPTNKRNYDKVFEICETRITDEKITVILLAHPAERMKLFVVKREENSSISGPVFNRDTRPFNGVISPGFTSKEIHIWKLIEGKWMKAEISYELLKMEK